MLLKSKVRRTLSDRPTPTGPLPIADSTAEGGLALSSNNARGCAKSAQVAMAGGAAVEGSTTVSAGAAALTMGSSGTWVAEDVLESDDVEVPLGAAHAGGITSVLLGAHASLMGEGGPHSLLVGRSSARLTRTVIGGVTAPTAAFFEVLHKEKGPCRPGLWGVEVTPYLRESDAGKKHEVFFYLIIVDLIVGCIRITCSS